MADPKPVEGPVEYRPEGAAAKLAYIQSRMRVVTKTGQNTHQNFTYFQEHGLLALLQPFQEELHVAILDSWRDVEEDGNMTKGIITLTFIDTDVDPDDPRYSVSADYPMQATDKQGWGAAKLLTYGKKFAMQKLFGIPTDDLPEAEKQAIAHEAAKRTAPPPSAEVQKLRQDAEAKYAGMKKAKPAPGVFRQWMGSAEDDEDALRRLVGHLEKIEAEAS